MKPRSPNRRDALSLWRLAATLVVITVIPLAIRAAAPGWWSTRGVLIQNAPPDDYAPVNQGQLKNIARAAVAEMDARLTNGAGNELHQMVDAWSLLGPDRNDFALVNLGQLKTVATPFYDRLISVGLADAYPWLKSQASPDDFSIANNGQVKSLFNFSIPPANTLDDVRGDRLVASDYSANLALESYGVWIWGNHLIDGTDFERNYPVQIASLSAIKSVAAGQHHLIALQQDGTVRTWGDNSQGQLGDGTFTKQDMPAVVPNLVNVVSVKAGAAHTLALGQDGTVFAWGDNYYGQLGTGDRITSAVPLPVGGLDNIIKIAAGIFRSVALKVDTTVWTWGHDHYDGQDIDNLLPVQVPDLVDVLEVATGYEHTVAVKSDGTVWAWGSNYSDQLGNAGPRWTFQATPVQVIGLTHITKIASAYDHTLALQDNGTVWAWGYNGQGQLGDGTDQARQTPIQVVGLTDVIAIATASSYSLAMKADGTVWAWGDFAPGILPGLNRRIPQQVGLGVLDTNHNGLDDRLELQFFGNLDQAADGDFDGDGISNLKEFFLRTNPADYYNGVAPIIEIAGGNNQLGDPATFLAKPYKVRVRSVDGRPLVNAPLTFTVTSGGGALAVSPNSTQQPAIAMRTDVNGEAAVYHVLPDVGGISTRTSATAGPAGATATVAIRGISRLSPPPPPPRPTPNPSATPGPSASPSSTPSATPIAPYRYAIIDLGPYVYPIRVNNKGVILFEGPDANGNWGSYRWKAGVVEALKPATADRFFKAVDLNDEGTVVGWEERLDDPVGWFVRNQVNEFSSGLVWSSNNAVPRILSGAPAPYWSMFWPGSIREAYLSAISNRNAITNEIGLYGGVYLGEGGYAWQNFLDFHQILNAQRWSEDLAARNQLSFSHSTVTWYAEVFALFDWQDPMDRVTRCNSSGQYIGSRLIPHENTFPPATVASMVNGQTVDFDPVDINEKGIVVGSNGAGMIIKPPGQSELVFAGSYAISVNDHTRPPVSSNAQTSPTATPQPTPIPAPQILGWSGDALALWELQPDGATWHPFGLEEMIPSMDGWNSLDPTDMNDSGLIVGTASYTNPSNATNPGEPHGFVLVPCEVMVDGNRDGDMSFDDRTVHDGDQTSEEKPYRFWLNDDDDGTSGAPGEHVPPRAPDYADGVVRSARDLEDFARLHVNLVGFEAALESGSLKAAFEWRNNSGPRIKLYRARSGSTDYLTEESAASSSILFPFRDTIGEVAPGAPLFVPQAFWVSRPLISNVPKTLPIAWFLFEGSGEGKGELVISFWKNGQRVGETCGVWLELKNVKRLFQRAKGTPLDGVAEPWSDESPLPTDFVDDPNGYDFEQSPDENNDLIIFVHGIHPPFFDESSAYLSNANSAETVYKRLWHGGYKGRFAFYKWPALNPAGYFLNGSGFEFNQSEYRGFKYGKGLARFAASFPVSFNKYIYAHSQGNAVAAAAFQNYGLKAKAWIATQGAIPISCFDDNLRHYVFNYVTPDSASDLGYRGFLDNQVKTRIVTFCNDQDTVTGKIWELHHEFFKPTVHIIGLSRFEYWYFNNPSEVHLRRFLGDVELSDRSINDAHESMSMVAKSRSRAIAHGIDVQGKVDEIVDLHSVFGFGDEHGSQWERPIQGSGLRYFERLVDETR